MKVFLDKRVLPPSGRFQAVCCDVVDLGLKTTKYDSKQNPYVELVFQIDARGDAGNRHRVTRRFKLSSHVESSLRQFLCSWFGRNLTDTDFAEGFDLETLVGRNAMIEIANVESDGREYANIISIEPSDPFRKQVLLSEDYQRVCDREERRVVYDY